MAKVKNKRSSFKLFALFHLSSLLQSIWSTHTWLVCWKTCTWLLNHLVIRNSSKLKVKLLSALVTSLKSVEGKNSQWKLLKFSLNLGCSVWNKQTTNCNWENKLSGTSLKSVRSSNQIWHRFSLEFWKKFLRPFYLRMELRLLSIKRKRVILALTQTVKTVRTKLLEWTSIQVLLMKNLLLFMLWATSFWIARLYASQICHIF